MRHAWLGVAVVGCVAYACGRVPLSGPPSMRLGRAECAECGMLINEDRCSSAMLVERGGRREHLMFDDIGCMLDYEEAHGDAFLVIDRFVHDHGTRAWLGAPDAVFLVTGADELFTPMGSGMVAFGDAERASQALARYGGELLEFNAIRVWRREWVERRRSGFQAEQ